MNKKYRNILLSLLCVVAVTVTLQAVCLVLANEMGGENTAEDPVKGGNVVMFDFKKLPADKDGLAKFVKEQIEDLKNNGTATNDTLTDLFFACDAEGYVHLTLEGDAYIKSSDGEKLLLSELEPNYVSRVTERAFKQMIELSETYVAHAKDLVYGNYYTPFNEITTNHIDCSSFTLCVLYGIPYETSRFATADDTNTAKYDLGITLPPNPYSNEFGPNRYLANELGHYAFDHGFAYYPNEDCTNVQPGDILFFSTNKKNEGYFMDITHVGICVERRDGDAIYLVHGNSNDVANYAELHLFSPLTPLGNKNAYMNSLVLVARFPVKADNS